MISSDSGRKKEHIRLPSAKGGVWGILKFVLCESCGEWAVESVNLKLNLNINFARPQPIRGAAVSTHTQKKASVDRK